MTRQELLQLLDESGITYQLVEHGPVYTIDEMRDLGLPHFSAVAKNLFIRDDKKRSYYLICIRSDRQLRLKEFREQFGTRPLSFASEKDLAALLGLTKGAVTPFGLLNDTECVVSLYLDASFENELIGIHPLENTATLWMSTADLCRMISEHGNNVVMF